MPGDDNSIFGNLPPQIDWSAPPRPTFPSNPADSNYSMPARIGSALGIEGRRLGNFLWGAVTLPGDVATGKTTMADDEAQKRVMDLSSLITPGPIAGGSQRGALSAGWGGVGMKKVFGGPLAGGEFSPELSAQLNNRSFVGPAANEPPPLTGPFGPGALRGDLGDAETQIQRFTGLLSNAKTREQADFYRSQLQMHSKAAQDIREQLRIFGPKVVEPPFI